MKKFLTPVLMFCSGGVLYILLELLWRDHSHWSMFMAGGTCFTLIDKADRMLKKATPLWVRCTIGAAIITAVEFVTGCIVNLWAHWNVWDYSRFKTNFMGQICLLYTILWFFLSVPVLWLAKHLHHTFDRLIGNNKDH